MKNQFRLKSYTIVFIVFITFIISIIIAQSIEANEINDIRLDATISQPQGPFYPLENIPLNNNLLLSEANNRYQLLHLSGRVLDTSGNAIENATVVIWQTDQNGIYRHPQDRNRENLDPNFKGFGANLTDAEGSYAFQTIIPTAYPGRPPHIHVKIFFNQMDVLTTQLYIDGEYEEKNSLMQSIFSRYGSKENLLVETSLNQNGIHQATFDFVIHSMI